MQPRLVDLVTVLIADDYTVTARVRLASGGPAPVTGGAGFVTHAGQ
jgi:hypothetical protein